MVTGTRCCCLLSYRSPVSYGSNRQGSKSSEAGQNYDLMSEKLQKLQPGTTRKISYGKQSLEAVYFYRRPFF